MLLSSLEVKLGISGDAAVVSGLRRVQQAEDQAAGGASGLSAAMSAMEIPALRAVAAAQGLAVSIMALTAGAIAVSGIRLAAQYEKLNIGFTTLLGSAGAARSLMAELQQIGQQTDFKTQDLVGFARGLLATDNSANKALSTIRALRAITDTMSATGGTTADVGQVASTLGQMRIATHLDMEQIKVLSHLGVNVPEVYKAATGQNVAPQIAMARLASMRGQQAFDTIITGMERLYKGAAAAQAGTALGLLQNIIETLGVAALPTGAALLVILKPIAQMALFVLNAAQKLNEMTSGVAGLVVILVLVVRGWTLLSTVAIAAYTATRQLTVALMEYAAAARGAATSTGAAAAASTASAAGSAAAATAGTAAVAGGAAAARGGVGAAAASGGAGAAGAAYGLKSLIPRLLGGGLKAVLPEVGAMLGHVGAFLKGAGPALAGLALSIIGGYLQGSKNNATKNTGDYLSNIGGGVGLGAIVAMLPIPPQLKIAAILIGGIAAGLKTWWDKSHEKPGAPENPMTTTNAILKDIHSVLIGGGDRSQRVKSELEAEYSLRHAVIAGVG